jgi:hypothetical protein
VPHDEQRILALIARIESACSSVRQILDPESPCAGRHV